MQPGPLTLDADPGAGISPAGSVLSAWTIDAAILRPGSKPVPSNPNAECYLRLAASYC